jgi:hypothetical protein
MTNEFDELRAAALHMWESDPIRFRKQLEHLIEQAIIAHLSGSDAYIKAASIRANIMIILEVNSCIPLRHSLITPSP